MQRVGNSASGAMRRRLLTGVRGNIVTVFSILVASAMILGSRPAVAEALSRVLDVGQTRQGLDFRVGGTGLSVLGSGTIDVDGIDGVIEEVYLYWGGALQGTGEAHDTLLVDGTPVLGTRIGTEELPTRTAYAYKAEVTGFFKGDTPPGGSISVQIIDPLQGDPSSGLDGATLLVLFRDLSDPLFHAVHVYEGCDYAWADNLPDESGRVEPVSFSFGAAERERATRIAIVAGDTSAARPDRILISGERVIEDELNSSDGPQWDTDVFAVTIPAGSNSVAVELESPPEFGQLSDSMQWILSAMRVSCDGAIGDFVWQDEDEDGIQDVGEPGIEGVAITLFAVQGEIVELGTVITDENGAWTFTGLCAGTYLLQIDEKTVPDGLSLTIPNAGKNAELDSDFVNGAVDVTLVSDTDMRFDIDAGYFGGVTTDTGACCLSDGVCEPVTGQDECDTLGGVYQGDNSKCLENTCPPVAACCFMDGSCQALTQVACLDAGGAWQGEGVPCLAGVCPQPEGACCLPDGSCLDNQTDAECLAAGGAWQGADTTCSGVACPQPTGACCLADGSCVDTQTEAQCIGAGGAWQGADTTCSGVTCPQPIGACCLADGSCVDNQTEAQCIAAGGTWQGMATLCANVDCPDPTGACCLIDGSCVDGQTEAACTSVGGEWQGMDVLCADVVCADPIGACCLPDGSCIDRTEALCLDAGGIWQGLETTCAGVTCPQPTGACCLPDGSCADALLEADCLAQSGLWQGIDVLCADVSCPQPTGACCLPDGSCVADQTEAACLGAGGIWQGMDVLCDDVECPQPIGACCLPSGLCAAGVTEAACLASGGLWQGMDSSCSVVNCPQPTGACCLPDGTCQDDLEELECDALDGTWQGMDVLCADVSCPQPTGACCLPDGSCTDDLEETECDALSGMWQGMDTLCGDVACPQPTGACCLPDGSCQDDVEEAACLALSGLWQGMDVLCADVSCPQPTGACCLPDGSCSDAVLEADCVAQSGTWQGMDVLCADVNCPQPTGACCFIDGSCGEVTEAACLDAGGIWGGMGALCVDAECSPIGACCLSETECVTLPELDCLAMAGEFQGMGTDCAAISCATGQIPKNRADATQKGSLLIFPMIEVRWSANGDVVTDTFVSISNDYPDDVRVQMYFINGDAPLPPAPGEPGHLGWNWVDNAITLTANQPEWWSARTGLPAGTSPWSVLDPGPPAGRPDPERPGYRVLRGYVIAFASNATGDQIRWNHLGGSVVTVDYERRAAAEVNAWSFPVVDPAIAHGAIAGTSGELVIDGATYTNAPSQLLMNFMAVQSGAFSSPSSLVLGNTDLTLIPVSADLRHDSEGPFVTKADISVWNENEVKLSGAYRCVSCWDQTLLSNYGIPNHFMPSALQTSFGKARIDGIASALCPGSVEAAMVGAAVRSLSFDDAKNTDLTGSELIGMGYENALIRFDTVAPPPEFASGK